MPRLASAILTALLAIVASRAPAAERVAQEPAISIRVLDYAHVQGEPLARASAIVSQLYEKIGVRVDWLDVINPNDWIDASGEFDIPVASVTILMLTPEMAHSGKLPAEMIGLAAVPEAGVGRVAFVVYDRLLQVARDAAADETEILGIVMAHEVGHLLLPRWSHSDEGLMRGHWDREVLKHLDPSTIGFSGAQASRIRRALGGGLSAGAP